MLAEEAAEHLDLGDGLELVGLCMVQLGPRQRTGRGQLLSHQEGGAETTQAGYGGMLGLVSIIVLFLQGYRPNNRSTGPGTPAGVRRTKGMRRGSPTQRQAAPTYPSYLHTAEVADILHVSPKTVSRWAKEGKLPFLKTLGGHRRYPEAEIRDLAAGLREEATA